MQKFHNEHNLKILKENRVTISDFCICLKEMTLHGTLLKIMIYDFCYDFLY